MHIKQVTGTIKGGVEATLTEKTLIVGANGSGKSAIVNAVELALVGGASDVEGRAWVQDAKRLGRLGDSVTVHAVLSDESTCSFKLKKGKADHANGMGGSLPYREVREALTGSPAKAYKFLLHQCAEGLTTEDVMRRLPVDLHDLYSSVAVASSPVEGLLEAQDVSAKKARDSAKEVKGAEQAATMTGQGLGPSVLDAEVADAQTTLQQAQAWANAKREYWEPNKERCARLDQIILQRADLQHRLSRMNASIPQGARERVEALTKVVTYHLDVSSPTCGVCGGGFDVQQARESLRQLAAWQQRIDSDQSTHIEAQIAQLNQEETTLKQILAQSPDTELPKPSLTVSEAQKTLNDLLTAKGAHDQFHRLKGSVMELERMATKWKALATVLDGLVKDFVDAGMLKFMVAVQRFLATDDVFGMKLTKSDCQIGFVRDERLTTALSGAEWARLLLAVACACASGGVPVIIPEERMWDRTTLAQTMRALTPSSCQIILTSTEKPKGKLPAGWTLVEV
jgi:energy-coupling factor transporter ATP-binding protein EcfA2